MEFARVNEERFGEVIKHLKRAFFADEPLNKAVNLCRPGEGHFELERHALSTLADNMSVMALTPDNRIVGVALNGELRRGDLEKAQQVLRNSNDERYKKIFNFLYSSSLRANIFDELNVDKMFEIRILSVDTECRGQGVAKRLLQESEKVARCEGFQVMKADATGFFSQKICKSLDFTTLLEIPYQDYTEEKSNEERVAVFNVDPPHFALKIMFKRIE